MKHIPAGVGRCIVTALLSTLFAVFLSSCGDTAPPAGGGGGGGDPDPLSNPVADALVSPLTGFIGDALSLDGSGSSDADGTVVDWEWDMGNGSNVFGETASYTYTAAGDYIITLTVTDNDGRTGSDTVSVSISDGSPAVDIGGPYGPVTVDGAENGIVNFSASATAYGGASIADYQWSYGDGTSENGAALASPSHQYSAPSAPGDYTVFLTVTDSLGRTGSDTAAVRVHQIPVADAGGNQSAYTDATLTFDGSGSYDPDSDGGISTYAWDLDDDGGYDDASGPSTTYSWSSPGSYTVGLAVTDTDGAVGTDEITVTVESAGNNLPPTADAGGPYDAVLVNTAAAFDGSGSGDPDGSINLYEWDFDYDGSTFTVDDTGQSVSHTYSVVGTYTVALRVSDDAAPTPATDTDTAVLVVHALPSADINDSGNPAWVLNGENFTLSASDSLPDGGEAGGPVDYIAEYRWDFDNDGSIDTVTSVPTVEHVYSIDGLKTVTLTVTDSNGEVSDAADTHTLTVHQAVTADAGGPYFGSGAGADNVFQVDDVITLDGTASDDPDSVGIDTIPSYIWDFDYDGVTFDTNASGAGPVLDISAAPINGIPGNYTMAVKAADPDDVSVTDIAVIDYRVNEPPSASFTHDPNDKYEPSAGVFYDALIDEVITFDASASADGDGTIATYEWDFDYSGTFSADASGSGNGITHSYSAHGSYTAALRVTDNDGGESAVYTLIIDIPENGAIDGSIE